MIKWTCFPFSLSFRTLTYLSIDWFINISIHYILFLHCSFFIRIYQTYNFVWFLLLRLNKIKHFLPNCSQKMFIFISKDRQYIIQSEAAVWNTLKRILNLNFIAISITRRALHKCIGKIRIKNRDYYHIVKNW